MTFSSPNLYLSRRRTLQVLFSGGGGIGLALLGDRTFAQSGGSRFTEPEKLTDLANFSFEVVTVDAIGRVVARKSSQASGFTQIIGNSRLEMVDLPRGQFMMGQTDAEKIELIRQVGEDEYNQTYGSSEFPRHSVSISAFSIGKYPVTQTQWRAVATLPRVKFDLAPNPSRFEGDNRPVENIRWHEAVEFCDRLSVYTKRTYTLPSEAQWEYACRANSTSPFYFGHTLTTELANYNGTYTYGSGPEGIYRGETTAVGSFPPNAFGLYDMHGNVREWCMDYAHDNYEGAPTDGSAWVTGGDNSIRILRGGSWGNRPRSCRSASRFDSNPVNRLDFSGNGFRVISI